MPAISSDGKRLVFVSNKSGNRDVWLKDLVKNQEVALSVAPVEESFPQITTDGSMVAYTALENQKPNIYVMTVGPEGHPGSPRKVCDDCGAPISWSSDQQSLLYFLFYFTNPSVRLSVLSLSSSQKTTLVEDPAKRLYEGQFCCEDRWVAFLAHEGPSSRVYVVPNRPGPISESEWIPITDGKSWEDKPRWSPDGSLIYFTSDRDGFRCIWAQRVDANKHPLGRAFPVYHSHNRRHSMMNVALPNLDISVARDKIIFNMGERTGNIWMMKLEEAPQ
jgi:eukaryotic-like serine/threonine-protein kinase